MYLKLFYIRLLPLTDYLLEFANTFPFCKCYMNTFLYIHFTFKFKKFKLKSLKYFLTQSRILINTENLRGCFHGFHSVLMYNFVAHKPFVDCITFEQLQFNRSNSTVFPPKSKLMIRNTLSCI